MPKPFLTARWEKLLLLTWAVPDELLSHRLPDGVELDRHEGSALVSLVAFDFLDTRVFGIRWPGMTEHPSWRVWPEVEPRLEVDFGALYGPEWSWLDSAPLRSAVFAEGSAVKVYPAQPLGQMVDPHSS